MRRQQDAAILLFTLAVLIVLFGAMGCATMKSRDKGAIVGAAAGGAVGGVVGNQVGSTAKGAIIGAVVGGTAGAIIGHQMDQQAKELKQNIPGATVERVGEGIHVTFASGLLFDFNSAVIQGNARSNLDALASSFHKYPGSDLLIVGHTDAVGSAAYNQDLSERRAASAARYLSSHNVGTRIESVGRGEDEPIASNDTESGRQKNRRVEVAIYASEALQADAKRTAEAR